jgi:alpha-tubulin suppressor-like RCC1 family protein
MQYEKSALINVNSQLFANNDVLVEITPTKQVYEHNFQGDPIKIEDNSEIIFINGMLQINQDGSIYLNKDNTYSDEKIAKIDGAISGSLSKTHIAVITKNGELYISSMNEPYDENYLKGYLPTDLTLINDIPKVKEVICCEQFTFILTTDGEVYGEGQMSQEKVDYFKKYPTENEIIDINGIYKTIIALDNEGNLYAMGDKNFNYSWGGSNINFEKIDVYKNIKNISCATNHGIALNKKGQIYYWGNHCVGKAAGELYNGKVKGISNADSIYSSGFSLYIIKNDTAIKIMLDN